ncbi:hypothetical protein BBL_3881 [Burkholderia pseudomallei MSHR1328]|nr:hypothetical protein Y042_3471 [Burkholderia pseudomallei MSHR1357]KKC13019.1 hypothetical protein BBL_3881 [Burkholderia pseudomallei MSHR1328]
MTFEIRRCIAPPSRAKRKSRTARLAALIAIRQDETHVDRWNAAEPASRCFAVPHSRRIPQTRIPAHSVAPNAKAPTASRSRGFLLHRFLWHEEKMPLQYIRRAARALPILCEYLYCLFVLLIKRFRENRFDCMNRRKAARDGRYRHRLPFATRLSRVGAAPYAPHALDASHPQMGRSTTRRPAESNRTERSARLVKRLRRPAIPGRPPIARRRASARSPGAR